MIYDLQKASALKRFSAFLLDIIVLAIIATLFCYIISVITGYDGYVNKYKGYQKQYEQEYGVSFDITEKDFNEMEEARTAFIKDKAVVFATKFIYKRNESNRRQSYLDKISKHLGNDTIIIIVGQRRVGKSYTLRLFRDKIAEDIIEM